jgi:hypothetical protein
VEYAVDEKGLTSMVGILDGGGGGGPGLSGERIGNGKGGGYSSMITVW